MVSVHNSHMHEIDGGRRRHRRRELWRISEAVHREVCAVAQNLEGPRGSHDNELAIMTRSITPYKGKDPGRDSDPFWLGRGQNIEFGFRTWAPVPLEFANRSDLNGVHCVARVEHCCWSQPGRPGGAAAATSHVGLDVAVLGWRRRPVDSPKAPLLLGTVNLAEVVDASIHLGRQMRARTKLGMAMAAHDTDDGPNDHDFTTR